MQLELERPLVVFDLETTGADVNNDKIVELAAVKLSPGGGRDQLVQRFNPGRRIPPDVVAIHGITNADVKDCPLFREEAARVHRFFKGADLGGFNADRFDIPLLQNELLRAGLSLDLTVCIVDACRIYHQREPRDLAAAVRFYTGGEHVHHHAALADVEATLDVLRGQLEQYADLPRSVQGIHDATRDPDAVDFAGKLRWEGDAVVLTFGKHKGTPLQRVDQGYLIWAKRNGVFGPDVVPVINSALEGRYPKR